MVCDRCIKAVRGIFSAQGLTADEVGLGEVVLSAPVKEDRFPALKAALKAEGFELIDDKRSRVVSQIKGLLVELIHYGDLEALDQNISGYLSGKLHKDYHYLSNLFSESENLTIEQFVIYQKIEKVKELLVYDELSLSEISFKMGYSSVAHLSAQFKKITGFTPTRFKRLKDHKRRPLDKI
jgi:AraC-like DNA-binding protein